MVCAIVLVVHDTVKVIIPPFIRVKGYHLSIDGKSTLLKFVNYVIIFVNLVIIKFVGAILMKEYINGTCFMWFEPITKQNIIIIDISRIKLSI